MSTDFAEIHDELRSVARDLLGKTGPRGDGEAPGAVDWRLLAESGWLGLEVPEPLDGAGATFAEVAVILGEMGRAATCSPYLGTVVLGVGALNLLQANPERDELLRGAAAGGSLLAVALDAELATSAAAPFRLEASGGGLRLHGQAAFVPDAAEADHLLLLALDPDGRPVVVHAEPGAAGIEVAAQPLLDATRHLGAVTADAAEVSDASVWQFVGDGDAAVRQLHDRAAVAVACDSLGLSEAMMEATVAYAGVRQQFGRPIGSFQAVKHACADMLVEVAVCRELVSAAVDGVVRGDADASVAASMAKSHVCGAAVDIVGKAMQLHGGIGYTWESGIHVYFKRAALDRSLFGSPTAHRKRLAERFVEGHPAT